MSTQEEFADRVFAAGLGAIDTLTMYIGDRLGYYAVLAEGASTPAELSARTQTDERYAREWLEQQAVTGVLVVEDGRYRLTAEYAEVLTDPRNLSAMAWMPRLLVGAAKAIDQVVGAFRTGEGVGWEEYGADVIEGQGDQNRPVFEHLLTKEWLPAIPDIHERLQRTGARVADLCCGVGWSSIVIARDYPSVTIDGLDLDASSIEIAHRLAIEHGVADRVRFAVHDVTEAPSAETYDLVVVFESIHDLPNPVDVLTAMRRLAGSDGAVVVMDERVADEFTAPGDDVERLMYGYSVLLCLPSSMATQPSAATGTVMRVDKLREYASQAGFEAVEVLPIEHPFFRLYRLV